MTPDAGAEIDHPVRNESGEAAPWPPPRTGWVVVAMLSAAALASQLDRMIINLLVEPIKADLHLTDTGFALLQGVAFGVFYTVMMLPIGWLADRFQRRLVIAGGLAMFSLFSMGTGLTRTYGQLFLTRTGVGVGEASLFPAGFSMISDHFPRSRLGRAIGFFTMSSMLGTAIAYIFGGALVGWLTAHQAASPQAFGGLRPWQLAFLLIGLPGLILAPFFLLLDEPVRRDVSRSGRLPTAALFRELWERRAALGFMFAGFSMVTLVSYSTSIWTPALFIRVYHWTPAHLGFWIGLLYLLFGISGGVIAGYISDHLGERGMLDAPLKVAAFGFVGVSLFGGLAPLMPSPWLALLLLAPMTFMISIPYSCAATSIQLILPNELRSQVSGLYLTVITLIGLVGGPVLVAQFTDRLFSAPGDVRYSLAIVVAAAGPIMLMLVLAACRPYRRLRSAQLGEAAGPFAGGQEEG